MRSKFNSNIVLQLAQEAKTNSKEDKKDQLIPPTFDIVRCQFRVFGVIQFVIAIVAFFLFILLFCSKMKGLWEGFFYNAPVGTILPFDKKIAKPNLPKGWVEIKPTKGESLKAIAYNLITSIISLQDCFKSKDGIIWIRKEK